MKKWYESKTLWVNFVALAASLLAAFGLDFGLTPEVQGTVVAGVMSVVNIILRFKTDKAVG